MAGLRQGPGRDSRRQSVQLNPCRLAFFGVPLEKAAGDIRFQLASGTATGGEKEKERQQGRATEREREREKEREREGGQGIVYCLKRDTLIF